MFLEEFHKSRSSLTSSLTSIETEYLDEINVLNQKLENKTDEYTQLTEKFDKLTAEYTVLKGKFDGIRSLFN